MERASRYDAIVATLVGVCALLVSAYTAYIQRQQVRAQVFPIVALSSGSTDEDVHVIVANKGSGPARIRNMTFSIGGKPIHNWIELVKLAVGNGHDLRSVHYSGIGRATISAGEEIRAFELSCKKPPVTAGPHTEQLPDVLGPADPLCATMMKLISQMSISVCFCSTLDDCSLLEEGPEREATTTDVRSCPARTDDSFN